jgi:putative protein-disulfide isomerase
MCQISRFFFLQLSFFKEFLLICSSSLLDMDKGELIYIYDAYCGWCYGFSAVMKSIQENYGTRVKISILSGGMLAGESGGKLKKKVADMQNVANRVTELTGTDFGKPFHEALEADEQHNNSIFPAIALCVVKELKSKVALEFTRAVQKARYQDGKDLTQLATYTEIISEFGIDKSSFILKYKDAKYEAKAKQEFEVVDQWGITEFPTLLYRSGDEARALTQTYQAYDPLSEVIETMLAQNSATS